MSRLLAFAVVAVLLGWGYALVRRAVAAVEKRQAFLRDYASDYVQYVEGRAKDEGLYLKLTERVNRMQREMGIYGVMALYRPPFANFGYPDFELLTNLLPEVRRDLNQAPLSDQGLLKATMVRDAMVRYGGRLNELAERADADLRNPLVWFRDAVRAVVALPVWLFTQLGILSAARGAAIVSSRVVGVLSGLVAFATLVAAVVTIIAGWDAASAKLAQWLS